MIRGSGILTYPETLTKESETRRSYEEDYEWDLGYTESSPEGEQE